MNIFVPENYVLVHEKLILKLNKMVKVKTLGKIWGSIHLKMYLCVSSWTPMVTSILVTSLELQKTQKFSRGHIRLFKLQGHPSSKTQP